MSDNTFVSRINQVDAVQLDDEIYKVLRNQTDEIAKYFSPGQVAKWRPEIDLLIKYFIWNYSLKKDHSTFGQRLMNLSYRNLDRRKSFLMLLYFTIPDYLRERLIDQNSILSSIPCTFQRSKYRGYIENVDNFFHLLNFIWIFFFLNLGNQPRFIEWLLGIYNQYEKVNKPRSIGYSYMTRELLWHGLIELFTISLPMIDFRYILKFWNKIWIPKLKDDKNKVLACTLQDDSICSHCKESPILPRWAGCSHIFCYYCLEALFMKMDPYQCPSCDYELRSADMKPC